MQARQQWVSGFLACAGALVASSASAQWYVSGAFGASGARASTVVIDQPSSDTHLEFSGVHWTTAPFSVPPYYFVRVGCLMGDGRQWGLEGEVIHAKMFAATSAVVPILGRAHGEPVDTTAPMAQYVTRYAMSHGMNLAFGNLVFRQPLARTRGAIALTARAGGGFSFPHAEVTTQDVTADQYDFGGLALQGAAGLDLRLARRLSALVEYKLVYARPRVDVPGGDGRATAVIQQVAFGLTVRIK